MGSVTDFHAPSALSFGEREGFVRPRAHKTLHSHHEDRLAISLKIYLQ